MNLPPAVRISENTERAVKSDLRIFARWCDEHGEASLPAEAETVAAFVDAMAEVRAPATVRRYVASITSAHRAIGMEKTLKSPPVRRALRRMHRRKGRRQSHAHALTSPLRRRMLEASGERLIDLRNCALLAVAYDTMLRRSERGSSTAGTLPVRGSSVRCTVAAPVRCCIRSGRPLPRSRRRFGISTQSPPGR